jgi:hypothetical protein
MYRCKVSDDQWPAPCIRVARAQLALSDCPAISGGQNFFRQDKNHKRVGGVPLGVSHRCGCRGNRESRECKYCCIRGVGLGT